VFHVPLAGGSGQPLTCDAMNMREIIRRYDERDATRWLFILLCGDLFFVALHLVNEYTLRTSLFDITADRKLPEIFQYFKFVAICLFLQHAAAKRGQWQFHPWMIFFTYLLLDDSVRIHEKGGKFLAKLPGFEPLFGLSMHSFSEMAVSVIAGSILIIPLLWAYLSGTRTFRAISHRLALLIGALVFCGVVVDNTALFKTHSGLINDLMEDGGEMIAVSCLAWYAFRVAARDTDTAPGLLTCTRRPETASPPRSN